MAKKQTASRKPKKKKETLTIKEDCLLPFYIVKDNRQFIVMDEDSTSTSPEGYYNRLEYALTSIAEKKVVKMNSSKTISLRRYIDEYELLKEQILNCIKI